MIVAFILFVTVLLLYIIDGILEDTTEALKEYERISEELRK